MIDWPLVYHSTMPASTVDTPRVTISEFTPMRATVLPLLSPTKAPMPMGTRMARPTGQPSRAMNPAHSTWVRPAIEPTEKSNSPQVSGMMMAMARMPMTAWLLSTFLMLALVGKVLDVLDQKLKNTNVRANRITSA